MSALKTLTTNVVMAEYGEVISQILELDPREPGRPQGQVCPIPGGRLEGPA